MNTPNTKSVWTARDEAALCELQERKARIVSANREPLRKLAETLARSFSGPLDDDERDVFVDVLIANADALRDALAPFDSGVRPG